MAEMNEKTVSSKVIFQGKIFEVDLDEIEFPNGNHAPREVIYHHGGCAVVALDENENLYLVSQYRYPFRKVLTELPAGKRDAGEEPIVTAKRELREEIGYEADKWISLGSCLSSPGCFSEELFLWLALDLKKTRQDLDPDEYLSIHKTPLKVAIEDVYTGKLTDSKTQIAILKAWHYLHP